MQAAACMVLGTPLLPSPHDPALVAVKQCCLTLDGLGAGSVGYLVLCHSPHSFFHTLPSLTCAKSSRHNIWRGQHRR